MKSLVGLLGASGSHHQPQLITQGSRSALAATKAQRGYSQISEFRLEIDGIQLAEFSEITIGEMTIGPSEPFDESLVRKLQGLRKFSTITMKRGFTTDQKLFDWYKSIADGKTAAACKRLVIVLMDEASGKKSAFWQPKRGHRNIGRAILMRRATRSISKCSNLLMKDLNTSRSLNFVSTARGDLTWDTD